MFLLNSRYPLLFFAKKLSFSLSYRVNLPSSLTFFIPFAFIYSTRLHAYDSGTVYYWIFPAHPTLSKKPQIADLGIIDKTKGIGRFFSINPNYFSTFVL